MLEYVLALSQWKLLGVCLLYACLLDAVCMEWRSSKCLRKGYGAKPPTRLQLHLCADVTLTGHRAAMQHVPYPIEKYLQYLQYIGLTRANCSPASAGAGVHRHRVLRWTRSFWRIEWEPISVRP